MAIKELGNNYTFATDITKSCAAIATRGVMVCYGTAGSGASIGESAGTVDVYPNPSGKRPAGLLLVDVVDVDQTRYHLNFNKEVMSSGSPVVLLRQGRRTVDTVINTPVEGDPAYLTSSGWFTPTLHAAGGLQATPRVGTFVSIKDANGYATIDFNLPY